jgi:hypothetical protein
MEMYNRAITQMTGRIILYTGLTSIVMEKILTLLDADDDLHIIGVDVDLPVEVKDHPRFFFKKLGSIGDAIFVPRAHEVVHNVRSSLTKIEKMRAFLSAHDFAKIYQLPFHVHLENELEDSVFLNLDF